MKIKFLLLVMLCSLNMMSEHRTVIHGGLERDYIIHVPSNINQDSPLVIVIHGYTSSAETIMTYSGMNDVETGRVSLLFILKEQLVVMVIHSLM